jgi:hypothetical protein
MNTGIWIAPQKSAGGFAIFRCSGVFHSEPARVLKDWGMFETSMALLELKIFR